MLLTLIVAGTTGLGTVAINAQSNDTFAPALPTGVTATGEIGNTGQEQTSVPAILSAVGTVTIETTVIPTNITVTDFLDES